MKIRNVNKVDIQNLKVVIDSSELFPSELLDEMMEGYFSKKEECIWLTAVKPEPSFVAYCAPEQMTEGT
ncbi:MAG: hypothetical protein KTR26_16040 [Flammeovirgaceae bacterium]|nr:hypothetical protein [Flammeovirgaceae bacterium]